VDSRYGRLAWWITAASPITTDCCPIKKRFAHGFSERFLHLVAPIDNANQSGAGSSGSVLQQFSLDYGYSGWKADKGSSGTDQRHRAWSTSSMLRL